MKRVLCMAVLVLLAGVALGADTSQKISWSFGLTNASGSTVTNIAVVGEIDRIEIDQTAGSSNKVSIYADSYVDQTILVYDCQVADVTLRPETLVHVNTTGASAAFYKPIWIDNQRLYCVATNYLSTTNALKVYLWLRRR